MKQSYTHQVTLQQDKKWVPFVDRHNRKLNASKFSKEIKRCSEEDGIHKRGDIQSYIEKMTHEVRDIMVGKGF